MSNNNWKEEFRKRLDKIQYLTSETKRSLIDWIESNLLKEAIPVEQENERLRAGISEMIKASNAGKTLTNIDSHVAEIGRKLLNQKEENNISQLQEVSPASSEGNSIKIYKALEMCLKNLPKKTYNCEPFGLMVMVDGGGEGWTAQYYSHYSKKKDDRIPQIKGSSIGEVLVLLYQYLLEKMPELLNQGSTPERSAARDDAQGDGDGNTINPK